MLGTLSAENDLNGEEHNGFWKIDEGGTSERAEFLSVLLIDTASGTKSGGGKAPLLELFLIQKLSCFE